ncbi:MAG: holo-ACP synthase, partial [Aeromicrobium sp.]
AGLGFDLGPVRWFAALVDQPGSRCVGVFRPGVGCEAGCRPSDSARHFAARWAAKEAVVKAWSASMFGDAPVMSEHVHHLIELVADAWGRPRIRLHGEVAKHLEGHSIEVSLSHDGDYAIAYVILSR